MALLGTLWDVQRNRTAAGATVGILLTYAHSLGTTPDLVLPVLRSVERLSLAPSLIAEGGNASLATAGVLFQSLASNSAPVVDFDLYVSFIWSGAR